MPFLGWGTDGGIAVENDTICFLFNLRESLGGNHLI